MFYRPKVLRGTKGVTRIIGAWTINYLEVLNKTIQMQFVTQTVPESLSVRSEIHQGKKHMMLLPYVAVWADLCEFVLFLNTVYGFILFKKFLIS